MGRRRKIRYQACSVQVTPGKGLLQFRFRWRTPDGVERRFAEATALRDTFENRKRVERQAEVIGAEIRARTFDYLNWFPNGNRSAEFLGASGAPPPRALGAKSDGCTVREYYSEWIDRRSAPVVRASAARDYRSHFRNYILEALGEVALEDLSLAHLEDLRNTMRQRGLSEKTIRNTIDGSFRAMVRDAEQDDLAVSFPFLKMRWPEKIVPGPSPFTERERDKILDYFSAKRWKVGGFNDTRSHYPYFAFLYTLFFTGMRPSELVAVRVGSINIHARTLQVERSRHLGAEAAPKTQRARRTVRLTPGNVEVLQPLIELKARPHDYLCKNVRGEPIEASNFYDLFRDAQRALSISPLRDLYSTKDTYISLALTNGVSVTWLSEQTGVALTTILKHYGRFIHSSQADDLEMSKIEGRKGPEKVQIGHQIGHQKVRRKKMP
jgi:integrase